MNGGSLTFGSPGLDASNYIFNIVASNGINATANMTDFEAGCANGGSAIYSVSNNENVNNYVTLNVKGGNVGNGSGLSELVTNPVENEIAGGYANGGDACGCNFVNYGIATVTGGNGGNNGGGNIGMYPGTSSRTKSTADRTGNSNGGSAVLGMVSNYGTLTIIGGKGGNSSEYAGSSIFTGGGDAYGGTGVAKGVINKGDLIINGGNGGNTDDANGVNGNFYDCCTIS